MADKPLTLSEEVTVSDLVDLNRELPYYGTLAGGDFYFQEVGRGSDWLASTDVEKLAALKQATKHLDTYSYKGEKKVSGQRTKFPRTDHTVVPRAIVHACYETANRIREGWSLDSMFEANVSPIKRRKMGPVETEYDTSGQRNQIDFIAMGLPSKTVYDLILPYLLFPTTRTCRVS